MQIRNVLNGGLAEVDDEYGARLIATEVWVEANAAPAQAAKPPANRPRRPRPETVPDPE